MNNNKYKSNQQIFQNNNTNLNKIKILDKFTANNKIDNFNSINNKKIVNRYRINMIEILNLNKCLVQQ